ncbi:MAG: winged helix-turn-helix transcriptional regulator [Actinobacteria bacterium]|nr:winged helix-turn-helix transcriptional regulator [Actinomycetota bacterium]
MAYAKAIDALADPTRRAIFEILRAGPRSVGDVAAQVPVSRPAVSQHLRVLREAGLVDGRAEGTRRIYGIRRAGLRDLRAWVEGFWRDALASVKEVAEREPGEGGTG